MRNKIGTVMAVLLFIFSLTSLGRAGMEESDPAEPLPSARFREEMLIRMAPNKMRSAMGMSRSDTASLCLSKPSARLHMMDDALSGRMMMEPAMMHRTMDREFFLDRAGELGLSQKQIVDLMGIRSDCRKDNIRTAAEAKIARLELDDLLDGEVWSVREAEKIVRRIETLKGDMKVRHLQAVKEAEMVLSEEQLRKARMAPKRMQLEELF